MNFVEFAKLHGVEIGNLRQGDRIFRCQTTAHPRSTNGAYHFDGRRGWVQNWETGEPAQWWNDPHAKPWTDAERVQWARRHAAEAKDRERRAREAARRAAEIIASCQQAEHDYLARKGFPAQRGLVAKNGALVIPMRECGSNNLVGAQAIAWDGERWKKKMLPGMRAKGAVLRIGPERCTESFLVEGYATGLSVYAAARKICMRASVYVAFSADNLAHVAPLVRGNRYVIADNDASGTGQRVAASTGLPWAMPERVGEDANDLHQRAGIMALTQLLIACRASDGRRVA